MRQEILEDIWAFNEAAAKLRHQQEAGLPPAPTDIETFDKFLSSFPVGQDFLADLLVSAGFECDRVAEGGALYDALAESEPGDDEESLCLRALYKIEKARKEIEEDFNEDQETVDTNLLQDDSSSNCEGLDRGILQECLKLDEKALILKHREHSPEATHVLVQRYSRFIRTRANRLAPIGRFPAIDADDLYQEGVIGLLRAAEKADLDNTAKFLTYAAHWINNEMKSYLSDHSNTVRLPRDVGEILRSIRSTNQQRMQARRSIMSDEEIREKFRLNGPKRTVEVIRRAELLTHFMGSIDTGFAANRDFSPGNDYVVDDQRQLQSITGEPGPTVEEQATNSLLPNSLGSALNDLSEREQQIIRLRYGLDGVEPLSLEDIAEYFNLKIPRIIQIESKALALLRTSNRKVQKLDHLI